MTKREHHMGIRVLNEVTVALGKSAKAVSLVLEKWVKKGMALKDIPVDGAFSWLGGPLTVLSRLWMHLLAYGLRVDWQAFLDVVFKAKMSAALNELKNCAKLFVHCEGDSLTPHKAAVEL